MDTNAQVILVLKLALNIAPPALYFVILGLVNSQFRPSLITSRRDWLALMVVFFPVMLYPALWLATSGYVPAGAIVLLLGAAGVYLTLPKFDSGWVVYNCSRADVVRSLLAAMDDIGIDYDLRDDDRIYLPASDIELELSGLPILRNTTITILSKGVTSEVVEQIEISLRQRLEGIECAMNPSGPAMLLGGTAMLVLPLLMMVHHMDAFVRVVSDFLPF
jgi:hypothetical protein